MAIRVHRDQRKWIHDHSIGVGVYVRELIDRLMGYEDVLEDLEARQLQLRRAAERDALRSLSAKDRERLKTSREIVRTRAVALSRLREVFQRLQMGEKGWNAGLHFVQGRIPRIPALRYEDPRRILDELRGTPPEGEP